MQVKHSRLGTLLLDAGVILPAELDRALGYQQQHGIRLGEALLKLGLCTEVHLAAALAQQMDLPFVDLEVQRPDPRAIQMVPAATARSLAVVPVSVDADRFLVVSRNPIDFRVDETLRRLLSLNIIIAAGVEAQINHALDQYEQLGVWATRPAGSPALAPSAPGTWRPGGEEPRLTLPDVNRLLEEHLRRGAQVMVELHPDGPRLRSVTAGRQAPLGLVPRSVRQILLSCEGDRLDVRMR